MPPAPLAAPIVALQVGAPPPPSSSVKTTLVPALLKVAECQNAKLVSSRTMSSTCGFSRSEMSHSTPSPMHAPAARFLSGKTVMSWQPDVAEVRSGNGRSSPGLPPSGKSTGVATMLAAVGFRNGTLMMEILSCGGWQSGNVALGLYDWTHTNTEPRSPGTSVCVCEPQLVSTALT